MRVLAPALAALILTAFVAHPLPAQDLTGSGSSPDGTRVQPSTTERIDRHNVCREVTNNTVSPIMVPHRSPTEWAVGGAAFLGNPYPNVLVAPCAPLITTIYDVGRCSVSAGGGDQSASTACGPDYETRLDMTFSFEDGTCEAAGLARLRRMIGQNLAASFWHGYLCQEVETGRPGHFHLGEAEAADPSVPDVTIGGEVHVVADPFTLSGLTADALLSWDYGGWSQGAAVRINGGSWVASETAPAASRTVRNGDRVEFALRTGGADANALNWALLTVTPSGSPELSLTRDFAVLGGRTVSVNPIDPPPPEPVYEPLTSGGGVSTTNETHPVFQLFQSCFQVPPGAYVNFPNACTLDETFWDSFETAACAPSPHGLTITMGGFALGNSGSACSEVGFDEFIGRAKVSTCEPASCGINENGPSSCTFRCE